jgi:hypothetical protein
MHSQAQILSILDSCCEAFTFPMLDNGYVYLAATRLSLYRSPHDWAIVIEVFGYSPRAGLPDTHVHTFASRLCRQKSVDDYVSRSAYETYLANNPSNESTFVFPIEQGNWQDAENGDLMAAGQHAMVVRGKALNVWQPEAYAASGITLQSAPDIHVYEACRLLAALERNSVLATPEQRRACIPHDLTQMMQLEEWNHPDIVNREYPSSNQTFQSLAEVLTGGAASDYKAIRHPNTHWSNWPDGGSL